MLYRPASQYSQEPHETPTSRATLSPGTKSVTAEPTDVTVPLDSCPRVNGSRTIMSPLR